MKKLLSSTILFLFISFHSFGQITHSDYITIDSLQKLLEYQVSKGDLDKAITLIDPLIPIYKERQEWTNVVSAINFKAVVYNMDKDVIKYKEQTFLAYNTAIKEIPDEHLYLAQIANNIAVHYSNIGNYTKSIQYAEDVIKYNNKTSDDITAKNLLRNYYNISNCYKHLGDTNKAIFFLRKYLKVQSEMSPNPVLLARSYHDLIGSTFKFSNQLDSTKYYLLKAEEILDQIKLDAPSKKLKIKNYLLLAEISETASRQERFAYLQKAHELNPDDFFQVLYFETLGKVHLSYGDYKLAIQFITKAQELAQLSNKRYTAPLIAKRYIDLAKAYYENNESSEALGAYQKGLFALSPGFTNDDLYVSPEADTYLNKIDALKLLTGKADLLNELSESEQNEKELKAAFDTYNIAINLIKNIRQDFLTTESKITLAQNSASIYEGAIYTSLALFNLTKEGRYKIKAFEFAELNKASILNESLNEQIAKGYAGIPDSLLEVEKDLKLSLAYQKKAIIENKGKSKIIKKLEDNVFSIQEQLDNLISNFEKKYPRYFELKYKNDPIDLASIQNQLSPSDALLEYFVGEKVVYLFIISEKQLNVLTLDDPETIYSTTQQFRTVFNKAPDNTAAIQEFTRFVESAFPLYKRLIEPANPYLSDTVQNLIIIPDDVLNYIPFSALLTAPADLNKPGFGLSNLDYLMEKYAIHYNYSATLLLKNKLRKQRTFESNFIGFAPSFKEAKNIASRACTTDELYSLSCSNDEVVAINNILDGEIYENTNALKSVFQQQAPKARIIHLATHACIDEQNANLNKIFLTDDYLSDFDLYNIELNADLAVLSACNTGSGELIKGEGVMSLARGFINAGCSSTLMSMWSVDDCATSDIMTEFYSEISTGMTKNEALRSAKLRFLETPDKTKHHPYYWAAFVPFGDMEAMEIGGKSNYLFYWIPIALLLIPFYLFIKKKSQKTPIS